jgi:hypothetical protein
MCRVEVEAIWARHHIVVVSASAASEGERHYGLGENFH